MLRPPFVWIATQPDPDPTRLYFGKSFIYPLVAAPFVKVFGTNGFLVLHALLLPLVVWCGYLFLHARMPARPPRVLAGAFVMATVVPVYFVWITPELFNFALGPARLLLLAVQGGRAARSGMPARAAGGCRRAASDFVGGGAARHRDVLESHRTCLLFLPIVLWLAWRRRWTARHRGGRASSRSARRPVRGQHGHHRRVELPGRRAATPSLGVPVPDSEQSAFDESVWPWRANESAGRRDLRPVASSGRTSPTTCAGISSGATRGWSPYFFPAVFALVAASWRAPRRRPAWQYLVLAGAIGQILTFVITLPYTWFGGGGSVGNRYFMGAYGIFLFLLPPISRTWRRVRAVGGRRHCSWPSWC